MTEVRPRGATFETMRTLHRNGFTIVEALVATVMFGVAGATLVASLTVMRALRMRALAELAVAEAAANHAALLARRPCSAADTSGASLERAVQYRWSAARSPEGWRLVDSVATAGARETAALTGYIACR